VTYVFIFGLNGYKTLLKNLLSAKFTYELPIHTMNANFSLQILDEYDLVIASCLFSFPSKVRFQRSLSGFHFQKNFLNEIVSSIVQVQIDLYYTNEIGYQGTVKECLLYLILDRNYLLSFHLI
jgi:hypothetical protein